ncbi:HAEPLYID family protein [Phnomibacter sp. MR]|uniref:HAEPLYID family protein n=1 Tax=Phnomibacter sp. MR TaxID=3042318 RepID=UPI003A80AD6C
MKIIFIMLMVSCSLVAAGQQSDSINVLTDSLYIASIEQQKGRAKIMHAEPLYIDLIRDLGARKGEREWNFGTGIVDNNAYDVYQALIEYEWAPLNRLGLEVELPFTFTPSASWQKQVNKLNSLKLAAQYTALVHEPSKTSVAVGYLHEFELPAFHAYGKTALLAGHTLSPFFIAAKRFGSNWHGLLYTGPIWRYHASSKHWQLSGQYNLSSHYMLPGTRNFIGIEVNAASQTNDLDVTIRPQMRLSISDNLLIGIVAGIPVKRENQRLSSFARIIYEPGHKHRH